ncbi:phospholipase D-like domain-containing protein [Actinocorallia populi]|uniref:hypothetical protein n=1 Tax=Actinocorallia populi TaxID=2079200 RepID=UPI000D090467|nr:hypothetical protein [Actinocorallia populi]
MNAPPPDAPRFQPPGILLKILVAVFSGGVAFALTSVATEGDGSGGLLWELLISVFIGGVTLVVQFMMDFDLRVRTMDARQSDHHARLDERMRQGFSQINEATELFGLVEASALRTDQVIRLVRYSTEIKETTVPIVHRFAETEINRLSLFLKELSDGGSVSYEGEDRDWLLALTQNVQRGLDATSLGTVDAGGRGFDRGFWHTDLGQRYLDLQREAVQKRGVHIRRVFIIDRSDLADDPLFLRMCRLQREAGIEVRLFDPTTAVGIPRSTMFDFVVFDGDISYESTPTSRLSEDERPVIVNTRLVLQADRVRERVRGFNALWDSARPVDP